VLIVDTYNVLHVTGVLPPEHAGVGVHGLARLIARSRFADRRCILVIDGTRLHDDDKDGPPTAPHHGVSIRLSGHDREADDVIEELLADARRSGQARSTIVVSSDRRVQKAAKSVRADLLDSASFLRQLSIDAGRATAALVRAAGRERSTTPTAAPIPHLRGTIPLSDPEVRLWAQEFGIDAATFPVRSFADVNANRPSQLRTPRPERPSRTPPQSPKPVPETPTPARPVPPKTPRPPDSPIDNPGVTLDPVPLEALDVWCDRMSPADFDMERWLAEHPPDEDRPTTNP
jgi:predicted RNA-binding protein with PIN domain